MYILQLFSNQLFKVFTNMSQANKDLYNLILADDDFDSVDFEYKGQKVQVREMSVKEYSEIQARSKDVNGEYDAVRFIVNSMIAQCRDPESGKQIFTRANFDALMNKPMGSGFVQEFSKALSKLGADQEVDEGPLVD